MRFFFYYTFLIGNFLFWTDIKVTGYSFGNLNLTYFQSNSGNYPIFLIGSALILFLFIISPRFKREGAKLQTPITNIDNVNFKILGINPHYKTHFYYHQVSNFIWKSIKSFNSKIENKYLYVLCFVVFILLALPVIIVSILSPVIFLLICCGPMVWLLVSIAILFPELQVAIENLSKISSYIELGLQGLLFISFIAYAGLIFVNSIINKDYSLTRHIQFNLDIENRVLKAVKGPKEDIPLHTLNSFRRHPFYPTGIIHNNSDLLNSPAIDWRIETNQGIGTTDELINYLNDLIFKAKIEAIEKEEKVKNLIE